MSSVDELYSQGIYIDDVNRLRILEPLSADDTNNFKGQCDHFVQSK